MRIETVTYEVASPDGTVQPFDTFEEAAPVQAATPGSQLRTKRQTEDVEAQYGVMVDGEVIDVFGSAHEAAILARERSGSVQMVPV